MGLLCFNQLLLFLDGLHHGGDKVRVTKVEGPVSVAFNPDDVVVPAEDGLHVLGHETEIETPVAVNPPKLYGPELPDKIETDTKFPYVFLVPSVGESGPADGTAYLARRRYCQCVHGLTRLRPPHILWPLRLSGYLPTHP